MLHMRLGEDPQWALVRDRERLEFTDPPPDSSSPRQRRRTVAVRTALGVASVLAITAILHADTAPAGAPATTAVGLVAHASSPDTGGHRVGHIPHAVSHATVAGRPAIACRHSAGINGSTTPSGAANSCKGHRNDLWT